MKKYFTNIHKNKTYNFIIRLAIIIATYSYIYRQLFPKDPGGKVKSYEEIAHSFSDITNQPYILVTGMWILVLMIVNWGIESLKWQFLINKIERVSFIKSYEAVLSGISVSVFTPNRVGEWFGRVFILKKANPWKGVFITIVGSLAQLLTTIIVGAVSLLIYIPIYFQKEEFYSNYWYYGILMLAIVLITTLILFFLNVTAIPGFLGKFINKRFVHFNEYLSVISTYTTFELSTVLLLSFLRYCVFALQFYLLLMIFSVNIPLLHGLMIISLIFFIMTAIPTDTLTALGIRGSVSLYFIGEYFKNFSEVTDNMNLGIFSASSALWVINLALPAILGTLFVFRLNFFRKKK
ncbi:MAG: flippase-like domain-containing protein [Bacteroidales bacterium]|nr:flippase-like domain-containing protein [Bacteroidales bacterium]